MSTVDYIIDRSGFIIFVSENWDEVADIDKGSGCFEEDVMNKNLWDFISDPETVLIYKMLLEKLKKRGGPLKVDFRCDTPYEKREFEIIMNRLPSGNITFTSNLKTKETTEYNPILDTELRRSDRLIKVCGWCKRVYISSKDKWVDIDDAVYELNLHKEALIPGITHSICDFCADKHIG